MSKNNEHIDKLLKSKLENFAPVGAVPNWTDFQNLLPKPKPSVIEHLVEAFKATVAKLNVFVTVSVTSVVTVATVTSVVILADSETETAISGKFIQAADSIAFVNSESVIHWDDALEMI